MGNKKRQKVTGIIPARYGSTRFPGKMLAPIHDKPLIQHTYENAKKCDAFESVIIATDDKRVFDTVKAFGGIVVMTSTDHSTGTDRLAEVVKSVPELEVSDIILNIQGDEPCVEPSVFTSIIDVLASDSGAVMSTAVTEITSEEEALSPSVVKCVIDQEGHALYFSRGLIPFGKNGTMTKGMPYYRHIGIYGFRRDFLLHYQTLTKTPLQQAECLEQLKVLEHGYKIKVAIVDTLSAGVDVPDDIKKIEKLVCNKNSSS